MTGRRVAIMQPTFLPWAGYLALLDAADLFVFLDDVQFRPRSWHSRNRLFTGPGAVGWITVPVRSMEQTSRPAITRMRPVLDDGKFARKLVGTLRQAYGASPHYGTAGAATEAWIERPWETLADLNIAWIRETADALGVETQTARSSELGVSGKRSELIANILRAVDADVYLSAAGSASYMAEDGVFPLDGVETRFQDYVPEPYAQAQSDEFVPYLSVLDLLLQVGAADAATVLRAGSRPWVSWDDMIVTLGRP